MKLPKNQTAVLAFLADAGKSSERRIARVLFDAPTTTFGRPMLLGVPSMMRALERRGLVRRRPETGILPTDRSWELTEAGAIEANRLREVRASA